MGAAVSQGLSLAIDKPGWIAERQGGEIRLTLRVYGQYGIGTERAHRVKVERRPIGLATK